MDSKSLALGVLKGIETHDFETVAGWFREPPSWNEAGLSQVKSEQTREGLIERLAGLAHLASGGHFVPKTLILSQDRVATVFVIETSKGRRVARTEGLLVLGLGGDKILGATNFINPRAILVQQGYLNGSFPVIDEVPDSPSVVEGDASFPEDFESAVFAAYEALSAGYPQPFQGIIADTCKVVDHLTGFEGIGVDAARRSLSLASVMKSRKLQFRKVSSMKAKEYLLIQWEISVKGVGFDILTRADLFRIENARIEEVKIFGNGTQLFGLVF
jgi:hypothetical protein